MSIALAPTLFSIMIITFANMPRGISQRNLGGFGGVAESRLASELIFDGEELEDFQVGCFVAGLDLPQVGGFGVEHCLDLVAVFLEIFNQLLFFSLLFELSRWLILLLYFFCEFLQFLIAVYRSLCQCCQLRLHFTDFLPHFFVLSLLNHGSRLLDPPCLLMDLTNQLLVLLLYPIALSQLSRVGSAVEMFDFGLELQVFLLFLRVYPLALPECFCQFRMGGVEGEFFAAVHLQNIPYYYIDILRSKHPSSEITDHHAILPYCNHRYAQITICLSKFPVLFALNNLYQVIIRMLKKEGGSVQELANSTACNVHPQFRPISQSELQQKLVHLQTILMLTQLNSAYFEMQLSVHKTLSKVEMKYFAVKMRAFTGIRLCKANRYEFQQKRQAHVQSGSQIGAGNEVSRTKSKGVLIVLESMEATKCRVSSNVKAKLRGSLQLLQRKVRSKMCLAFHLLMKASSQSSTLKIHSDKSSKIETIDSQKSKVFKRSAEKRVSRKSFSLQKSITNEKGQGFVPVKYQANVKITPPMSSQASGIQGEQGKSDISKLLKNVDLGVGRDRRSLLSSGRQRKLLKSTSSKKYNASLATQGKQQKIRQLQYLQRKYKKLIAEFNWFSERFLKVIEEQPI